MFLNANIGNRTNKASTFSRLRVAGGGLRDSGPDSGPDSGSDTHHAVSPRIGSGATEVAPPFRTAWRLGQGVFRLMLRPPESPRIDLPVAAVAPVGMWAMRSAACLSYPQAARLGMPRPGFARPARLPPRRAFPANRSEWPEWRRRPTCRTSYFGSGRRGVSSLLRPGLLRPGATDLSVSTGPRSARSVWSRSSRKSASFIAAADCLPGIRSGYRVRIGGAAPPVAA